MSSGVRVRNLTRRFGAFTAVDQVTFSVEPGEIFGFLGSNGAGKTTIIRMLCGLLHPTSGEASVEGYDVYSQAEQIKQSIGYMSQRFSLYDELTVAENLRFFGGVYGLRGREGRERRREITRRLGLEDRRHELTAKLPGGWKQRLALGCAILHDPPVLFLDEPTSGVDPIARRQFWKLIEALSRQGHTIFVTTHYMDEAEYCGRLALMHAGRIIALDSPQGLKSHHAGSQPVSIEDVFVQLIEREVERRSEENPS
ncbi:MAG TPA: ABC transporter ATP-binding protein [Acidobacteriota bacterium]|nr:ABC transporter ATP-binding protein [Acidobacteriota bacterium]